MRLVVRIFLIFLLLFGVSLPAHEKEVIRFGVFAYLGVEQTREKYAPLEAYLNRVLEKKVVMEFLTQEEMDAKIAAGEIDIATTNPTHFLVIRQNYSLSGALATLVNHDEQGKTTSALGGVIVVRSDSPIRTLADLRGKTIATPSTKHMGGYRAQLYELHTAGLDIADVQRRVVEMHGSHQEVVRAVLARKADAGFIRDGILEHMIARFEIPHVSVRIINEQPRSMHPYRVSTRLYPEWPVFALPNAMPQDVKAVLGALLTLAPSEPGLAQSGIYGYTLPADYLEVEELSRALRLPPFDAPPAFTLHDIWERHTLGIVLAMLLGVMMAAYYLLSMRRKKLFETLLSNIGDGVYGVDREGRCVWVNDQAAEMLGYTKKELLNVNQHTLFHHHKPSHEAYDEEECPIHLTLLDHRIRRTEEYFIRKDGTFFPVSLTVAPLNHHGAIVVFRDISEEKELREALIRGEANLKKAQAIAHIGSWELDLQTGRLEWSREIFRIFGIDPEHFSASYEAFMQTVHPEDRRAVDEAYRRSLETGEKYMIEHRLLLPEGGIKWVREVGDNEYDAAGNAIVSRGTVQDITEEYIIKQELKATKARLEEANNALQQTNEELRMQAMYDGLTHIPNRRYFDETFEKKFKEASREKLTLAVLMIDVDFFKRYNDLYGHAMGDECLIAIARSIRSGLKRPTDFAARYGGEEFVVVLKGTDRSGALRVAETLREGVASMAMIHGASEAAEIVTISIGMALREAGSLVSRQELLREADEALYRAKERGRNRIEIYAPAGE